MTHTPQSKFQLITVAPLPSDCVACGSKSIGSNEFVDLTKDIDYYGAILLCKNCAVEVAELLGFIDSKDADDARLEAERLTENYWELKDKVEALEHLVFTYRLDDSIVSDELPVNKASDSTKNSGKPTLTATKSRSPKSTTI